MSGTEPTATADELLHASESRVPRWTKVLVVIGALSLLGGLALSLLQRELGWIESHGADGYSRSALGHSAWIELLRDQGFDVRQSRRPLADRIGPDDGGIVAEPKPRSALSHFDDEPELDDADGWAAVDLPLLVVLPRREAVAAERGRVVYVDEFEKDDVERVARRALGDLGDVGEGAVQRVAAPVRWTRNTLGLEPDLPLPQLLTSSELEPLVACEHGILIGHTRGHPSRIVLADPDLIANHGLGRGDNAALAVALVELLGIDGTLWYDEVAHGFTATPSSWAELFQPPLLWITLHALAGALLLAWSASIRFGSPRPPRPAFGAGKRALIENVSELMEAGGHALHSTRRYVDELLRQLAAALHAPPSLRGIALAAWLAERIADPALRADLQALVRDVGNREPQRSPEAALAIARRAHRLKEAVLHAAQ
ncbi:MAG: hypothetical protein JNL90_10845 [Planctomycetes bacterium]|nr:hypothetical protein [Planctomycetota bacterium]